MSLRVAYREGREEHTYYQTIHAKYVLERVLRDLCSYASMIIRGECSTETQGGNIVSSAKMTCKNSVWESVAWNN